MRGDPVAGPGIDQVKELGVGQRGALPGERREPIGTQSVPALLLQRTVDGRVETIGGHVPARGAEEQSRILNDPASLSHALLGRLWATWWPENPEEREAIAREMVGIAEALGDGERIADAHLMLFLSLSELGRVAEARREMDTLDRVVEELRQPAQRFLQPILRGELALLEGVFALAEELIAEPKPMP